MYQLEIISKNLTEPKQNEDRIFEAYVSVEIIDRQKDLVKIDGLAKTMDIWLNKRTAPITDSHTNRVVGQGLKYEIRKVKDKLAIWLKAKIFKDYKADDIVWEKIQTGAYSGVSIGGNTFSKYQQCDTQGRNCYNVIPSLDLFEVAVVDKAANQLADIIAKQKEEKSEVVKMSEVQENEKKVEAIKKEEDKSSSRLDIYINQATPVSVQKEEVINLEDLGNFKPEDSYSMQKSDDFCQCNDDLNYLDKSNEVSYLSDSVDSLLNKQLLDLVTKLTGQVDALTNKVYKMEEDKKPAPPAKKPDDENPQEEASPDEEDEGQDKEKKPAETKPAPAAAAPEAKKPVAEKPKEAKKSWSPDPTYPTESAYSGTDIKKTFIDIQKIASGKLSPEEFEQQIAQIRKRRNA